VQPDMACHPCAAAGHQQLYITLMPMQICK
jgi:hypothetical protein